MHVQQAELATMAFLERNPKDFDNSDLLKLLFLKPALAKAQDERVKEMVEFRAKQLHQKAEIGQIDILATRDNEVLAAVTGQIIRSGIFQDKAFTEAFPFTRRLKLSVPAGEGFILWGVHPIRFSASQSYNSRNGFLLN